MRRIAVGHPHENGCIAAVQRGSERERQIVEKLHKPDVDSQTRCPNSSNENVRYNVPIGHGGVEKNLRWFELVGRDVAPQRFLERVGLALLGKQATSTRPRPGHETLKATAVHGSSVSNGLSLARCSKTTSLSHRTGRSITEGRSTPPHPERLPAGTLWTNPRSFKNHDDLLRFSAKRRAKRPWLASQPRQPGTFWANVSRNQPRTW